VGCVVDQEVEVAGTSRFTLCATALALVLVMPAAAAAGGERRDKKEKEIVAVSESGVGIAPGAPAWVREQVAAIHAGKVERGGEHVGPAVGPQARNRISWYGCKDVWAYRGYDHWLGYNLFRYYQQVSWCSNGYTIYSWSRFRWPELNGPGWGFDGHLDSYLGGSTSHKRAWTQGQFHACFTWYCDYKAPWVNIDVYLDGGWSANTGG
jgi:hypothetical protein